MTVVNFRHGLFLTCTQKSCYIYKSSIAVFTGCTAFPSKLTPCVLDKIPRFTYLESQLLCSWWWLPIHPCLWSANNCPIPWLLPLSPFHTPQLKLHYLHRQHQQSWSSSPRTVNLNSKFLIDNFTLPVTARSQIFCFFHARQPWFFITFKNDLGDSSIDCFLSYCSFKGMESPLKFFLQYNLHAVTVTSHYERFDAVLLLKHRSLDSLL
jgi:hypothetical protein